MKKFLVFQLRLRYLFASIFIAGLGLNSAGEAKGEDNLCNFSTPKEYARCLKKDNVKLTPKYPLETSDVIWLGQFSNNISELSTSSKQTFLVFKTNDGKKLEIKKRLLSMNAIYGITRNGPTFHINGDDIIFWKFDSAGYTQPLLRRKAHFFEILYLDNYGNQNKLIATALLPSRQEKMLEFLFRNSSGVSRNQKKDIQKSIENKLYNNQRRLDIIQGVIKKTNSSIDTCLEVKDKYPDLVDQYEKLYKSINPLRAKLNMGKNPRILPLCR